MGMNNKEQNRAKTMAYLKERAETEATLKCEKLEIKRKELALQAKEQLRGKTTAI